MSKVNVVPSGCNISDKVRVLVLTLLKYYFSLKNCLMNTCDTDAIKKEI